MKLVFNTIISSIIIISLSALVTAQQYGGCGLWMMGYGTGTTGYLWIFGFIFWILVIIALILLIAWLIKQLQHPKQK